MGDLWKLIGRGEDEVGLPVSSERRKRAYALPASPIASSHPRRAGHPRRRVARQSLLPASAVRPIVRRMVALDRVEERRRAVALARHYRDEEGLSIAEIARRLGRAEATVKAYLYDPSYANKGHYTSLGATRAVYGAPRAESRPGLQQDRTRTHAAIGVAAPARRPSRPALERTPTLVDGAGALRLRRWLEYRCSRNTT